MELAGYWHDEAVVEHFPVGVALLDAQTFCLLTANPLYYTFLNPGWQEGQAIGRPVNEWFPEAEETGVMTILRTVAETGIPYRADTDPFLAFNRGTTYWNWSLEPLRDADGHIRYLLFTGRDITAHVQARQQIEHAHEELRREKSAIEEERQRLAVIESVARSAQIPTAIKRQCRTLIAALAARFPVREIFVHMAEPEHAHLCLVDRFPEISNEVDLSIRQMATWKDALQLKRDRLPREPFLLPDLQELADPVQREFLQPFIRTGARGYLCVPLWKEEKLKGLLTVTFSVPISLGSPEVEAFRNSSVRITSILMEEHRRNILEQERADMHTAMDQLPEGVLIVDAITGTINYANALAAQIIGISHSELVGFPFRLFSQQADVQDLGGQLTVSWALPAVQALTGETIDDLATVVNKPDGSQVLVHCSSAPLRMSNGEISGAIIIFQERTGPTRFEEEKDLFLSLISHELRTPMTVIIGYIELLEVLISQGNGLDITQLQQVFGRLNQQSDYLARLIEELLEIAHLAAGQVELQTDVCEFLPILQQVIERVGLAAEEQKITLTSHLSPEMQPAVCCDEYQIARVFTNLISNAVKYSPQHQNIEVEVSLGAEHPAEIVCSVKDQGMGIAVDELPHIFTRFYRTARARSLTSGLGIGLYLVKEIIDAHGGRIQVESKLGKGSTFSVTLPLYARELSCYSDPI